MNQKSLYSKRFLYFIYVSLPIRITSLIPCKNQYLTVYHPPKPILYPKYHTTISSTQTYMASPKRGSKVDRYQTVSVNCSNCQTRIFRYKKKNGTKSNLIKCYIERIVEDSAGVLENMGIDENDDNNDDDAEEKKKEEYKCPKCDTVIARPSLIHGRPALKFVGGKIRMTKK